MTNISDILEQAADLIEPEGAWARGWTAKRADGAPTFANDPLAVCWCAAGAICRVGGNEAARTGAMSALRATLDNPVSDWNDAPGRTQSEVVARLREASAKAKELGQ